MNLAPTAQPGPAREDTGVRKLLRFLVLMLQLSAAGAAIYFYGIEKGNGLVHLLPFFGATIAINYWLPSRFRHPLLILSAFTVILYAFGLFSGSVLIITALTMIGICHLPVRYYWRVALLLLATGVLAALRLQAVYLPRVLITLPVLGSMLMFRLILYMHERKHEKPGATVFQRISYFFIPVNIAFPLFPILDYKTWLRGHYEGDAWQNYQQGARRIAMGILHLLLYRIVYQYTPNPATLGTPADLLLYFICSYGMILRIMGIFWIATGLLGLLGFRLPPVFNNVFLVSGFGDIWRRINIYWREFMLKVVYYPVYFKVRKKARNAIFVTAMITFVVTWLFHSWQSFWLRADPGFKLTDTLYWMVLGTCIAIAIAREANKKPAIPQGPSMRKSFFTVLRMMGMFFFMSILWTLWNSTSLHEWAFLLSRGTVASDDPVAGKTWLLLAGGLALFLFAASLVHFFSGRTKNALSFFYSPRNTPWITIAVMATLVGMHTETFRTMIDASPRGWLATIKQQQLNQHDRETAEQGYYEQLVDQPGSNNPWSVRIKGKNRTTWFEDAVEPVADIRLRALIPGAVVKHENVRFSVNRWGMRDRDYPKEKPANTIRIALIGSSYEMGSGVGDEEVAETIVEKFLGDSLRKAGDSLRIEILNFSAGGYHVPQLAWQCDNIVYEFDPDIVIYAAHSDEVRRLNSVVARIVQNNVDPQYDSLRGVIQRSGADQTMSRDQVRNRLKPYNVEMLSWGYGYIASSARAHGAVPVWVYIPTLTDEINPEEFGKLSAVAASRGFECLDLRNVYGNVPQETLRLDPEDNHPNPQGQRMIAEGMRKAIQRSEAWKKVVEEMREGK